MMKVMIMLATRSIMNMQTAKLPTMIDTVHLEMTRFKTPETPERDSMEKNLQLVE